MNNMRFGLFIIVILVELAAMYYLTTKGVDSFTAIVTILPVAIINYIQGLNSKE